MVKTHPSYADMVNEAFANVDRHAKLGLIKLNQYLQEAYEIDTTKTSSKQALKRALEHAVKAGELHLVGASYKMTATGFQHLRSTTDSPELTPKKPKKQMAKKKAVKESMTRIKTPMKARVKAGTLAASKKKTNRMTKNRNGSAMTKVKTQAKTSADAKTKDKLTTSNKVVAVPADGDAEASATLARSDERPPADGEETQTETEREGDEEGELPISPARGLEVRVEVGGKNEEQVTPEKNKINSHGSVVPDGGKGPGAPRKRSAHRGE